MTDAAAIVLATSEALGRPRDLPLAAALPAPMELAIVVADDDSLEAALPVLIEALAPLGIACTHLEVVLCCDAGGAPRRQARERLRAALGPTRVHAHDAGRGDTYVAARLDEMPVRLDDALRESEGVVLVLAMRPGATGAGLAGEAIAALADAETRARLGERTRALIDALPIDLALVIETGPSPRAWAGTGRWLLAERFPPAGAGRMEGRTS